MSEENRKETVTVFLPDPLVEDSNICRGLLLGRSATCDSITYVTVSAFLPLPYPGKQQKRKLQLISLESDLIVVGSLSAVSNDVLLDPVADSAALFIRLLKSDRNEMKFEEIGSNFSGKKFDCHIIPFTPKDFLQSQRLRSNSDSKSPFSIIRFICQTFDSSLPPQLEKAVVRFHSLKTELGNENDDLQNSPEFGDSLFWKLSCYTTTGSLLCFRIQQLKYMAFLWRTKQNRSIEIGNILSAVVIDVLIGVVLTKLIFLNPDPRNWLIVSVSFAETVISRLETLINTLMEMPAGLKLNRLLNSALGQFFLYHIYLLRTYMSIVKPVYMAISGFISLFGMFGMTCILSIICDLFSLATIHIFCFYGYAARLYSFQTQSLSSLWRLFRGKKWNQLKSRVDSYSYQYDQLFIGSICFTIVIFLLPTVLLYYSVFLVLRIATMTFLIASRMIISKLSIIPAYAFVQLLMSSKKLVNGILFDTRAGNRMKTSLIPFSKLFETNPHFAVNPLDSKEKFDMFNVISTIVRGDLLAPF